MQHSYQRYDTANTDDDPLKRERLELLSSYIKLLPAKASHLLDNDNNQEGGEEGEFTSLAWNPQIREVFTGVYQTTTTKNNNDNGFDPTQKCVLSNLRGMEDTILRHILSFHASEWAKHVTRTIPAGCVGDFKKADNYGDDCEHGHGITRFNNGRGWFADFEVLKDIVTRSSTPTSTENGYVSFCSCHAYLEFPTPADRNVNMMPFIFGDSSSLPDYLQCYYKLIECCPYLDEEIGKVGYLTVHEEYIEADSAQRREGLHIETPGNFQGDDNAAFTPGAEEHHWGSGRFIGPDKLEGGIFMASNIQNTSQVFDALVDKTVPNIVDRHGGCEHLRKLIGPGTKLAANELIWMTDCTPHEALPQKESGYRQFFRVVTSKVSHWFAQHSTPNPLVPLPDSVIVVHDNKFVTST